MLLTLAALDSARSQTDPRDHVKSANEVLTSDAVVDVNGAVAGMPFGVTEDQAIARFGKLAGYIRLDEHRTALLYGKSCMMLCFDGRLDAVKVGQNEIDWQLSSFLRDSAPFTSDNWSLSNGLRKNMDRKEVRDVIKGELGGTDYNPSFETERCLVELTMVRMSALGDADEAYKLYGFMVSLKHDGRSMWSAERLFGNDLVYPTKGKKYIGVRLLGAAEGMRVAAVLANSPAEKAGIKAYDLITKINEESAKGMTVEDFASRVAAGGSLELEVASGNGIDQRRTVKLEAADPSTFGGERGTDETIKMASVGQPAPDFEAVAPDLSRAVKLADLKGSLVLISFTSSWSDPCRDYEPLVRYAYEKFKKQGLKVISVYMDGPGSDPYEYAKSLGESWPIFADGHTFSNRVAQSFGVSRIPTNVLIGKDGRVLRMNVQSTDVEKAIEEELAKAAQ